MSKNGLFTDEELKTLNSSKIVTEETVEVKAQLIGLAAGAPLLASCGYPE